MKKTLILASLISLGAIGVIAFLQASDMPTGLLVGEVTQIGTVVGIALGLSLVGITLAFLWNK